MASTLHGRRDALGSVLGLLTFLGGVALLLATFRLAYGMFLTPPSEALGVHPGHTLDLNTAGTNLTGIVLRIILLLVMGVMGSVIANRGILLYTHSRGHHLVEEKKPKEPAPESSA